MNRTILSLLLVLTLLAVGSAPAGAKGEGVDDLRGKWVFTWTLNDGTKEPPLELYVNDIGPGTGANAYLATGCMRSLASGATMPLSLAAVFHPVENTYDLVIYSTIVPPAVSGQPPYVIRFDGLAQINGAGVTDDRAAGTFLSNPAQGTWDGRHHDRRRVKCPAVDMGGQRLDTDVYAQHDLGQPAGENISMTLEGRSISIVSSAMRVTAPDGQVFDVPFYTDMFSPSVDFINEFRFIGGAPGAPISGKPYQFILLDALGQPIPGTESQDSWTRCYDAAPGQSVVSPNPVVGQELIISWTGVPTISGEFEPGTIGFYQMGIWPQEGQAGEFGVNWMGSTTHIIPWSPFNPGSPGAPDGYDHGVSLSEFGDGQFRFSLSAFYQPNPASGSFGLECAVSDNREDLLMTKSGDLVEFYKP